MKRNFFKPVFAGMLIGTLLFFAGPLILLVLLLKFIFTPFGMHRLYRPAYASSYRGWMHRDGLWQMADKLRAMDDSTYQQWKDEKMNSFNGYRYAGCRFTKS
jgi:hypothetical protein